MLKKTFTYLIIFSIDLSLESVDLRISFFDQILKLEHSGLVVLDLVSGVFSFVLESRYLVCGSNELDFAVVQFSNQFGVRSFLQKKACNINGYILKQFKFHQRVTICTFIFILTFHKIGQLILYFNYFSLPYISYMFDLK